MRDFSCDHMRVCKWHALVCTDTVGEKVIVADRAPLTNLEQTNPCSRGDDCVQAPNGKELHEECVRKIHDLHK